MIVVDVIAYDSVLIVSGAEQNIDRVQIAYRSLGVDIEFAQRLNGIAKELETHRQRRLPRIKIDNSTANSELAAGSDLGNALITGVGEFLEHALPIWRSFSAIGSALATSASNSLDVDLTTANIRRNRTKLQKFAL